MRSLTELAGLEDSSLATISASHPSTTLDSFTIGVFPMSSSTLSAILGLSAASEVNARLLQLGAKADVPAIEAAMDKKIAEENLMIDF